MEDRIMSDRLFTLPPIFEKKGDIFAFKFRVYGLDDMSIVTYDRHYLSRHATIGLKYQIDQALCEQPEMAAIEPLSVAS